MAFDVVIAGAGIAGIEGLLRLRRLAGDAVQITVLSPTDEFVYRPMAVLEPFCAGSLRRYPLKRLIAPTDARHVRDRLMRVDTHFGMVTTATGQELPYDALLVAPGAGQSNPYPHATLFTDRNNAETFSSILTDLNAGRAQKVAFVAPSWPSWPLPLYELALLTANYARRNAIPVQLTFITSEPRPLKVFGRAAGDAITQLLAEAGISLRTSIVAEVPGPGRLLLDDSELHADRIVTLPRILGPAVPGLAAGAGWFVPVDDHCCVPDTEGRVFAAGDVTDSPIKHGGLGAQQADAAAAGIAHLAGAAPRADPITPIIRGTLLTGDKPLYLTARVQDGLGWSSEVHSHPPWPFDHKLVAEELAPYLASLADPSS